MVNSFTVTIAFSFALGAVIGASANNAVLLLLFIAMTTRVITLFPRFLRKDGASRGDHLWLLVCTFVAIGIATAVRLLS